MLAALVECTKYVLCKRRHYITTKIGRSERSRRSWIAEFGTLEGITSGTVEENSYFQFLATLRRSIETPYLSAKFENTISIEKDCSLQFGYLASAASVLDVGGNPVTAVVRQADAGDHAIQFGAFF